ncbi:uncharacterized [Tachysurus ichikawai]
MGNAPQQDLGAGEPLIDYHDSAVKQGSEPLARAVHFLRRSISIEQRLRQVKEAVSDAVRTAGVQISSVFCCLSFVPIRAGLEYYGLNMKGNRLCHVTI